MTVPNRKLIEVALPLEKINTESAREKAIRHGHPSTLHLWWSRKPLATARTVLFSQLVDDPSSHPENFGTEEAVTAERRRLHQLIERLAVWENSNDSALLREARQEILNSTGGNPPPIYDPFAGGGSIPLEAQRLGLEVYASDLNPVAVLINKALIEIPSKFAGTPPVFPGAGERQLGEWPGATGLAEDVQRYGQWMRDEVENRIGHLYPKAELPDGSQATVIAWVWARTVRCPNPACGIQLPLTSKWALGKKKNKESYIVPHVVGGRVTFSIGHDPAMAPQQEAGGTVDRNGARCIACGAAVSFSYIRTEGKAGRLGAQLMATAAEGKRRRIYLSPTVEQETTAEMARTQDAPEGDLPAEALGFRVRAYGMTRYADLFTARQLAALTTFSSLVSAARHRAYRDALSAGLPDGERLEDGGTGAAAYADAVATYLGLGVSRYTNFCNSLCQWRPDAGKEQVGHLFSRQAIPMAWDFAEANIFSNSAGGWTPAFTFLVKALRATPAGASAKVSQASARTSSLTGLLSTDPPYYDNIGYSDLSDFFYVWLRKSLASTHSELLSTLLTPKSDELVANPFRHAGKDGARQFFESGFTEVFQRARSSALQGYPITVYYAFKQSETSAQGEVSTGWESLLQSMISTGWTITATWPMRSELSNRMRSLDSNALASSIVLALRPRINNAPRIDRRGFMATLKEELPRALRDLQQGAIAPVDLPQAAIGPGMAVFSRYSVVLEDDGSAMQVRTALARINEVLDEVLSEQEGDFDPDTRFALAWFRQHGFEAGPFGSADGLARARNASVEHIERAGILMSRAGKVTLLPPAALPQNWDPATDTSISTWEVVMHLARVLIAQGVPAASQLLGRVPTSIDRDLCKELAFLLFALAEDAKRAKVAVEFNSLGTAWNDIESGSRAAVSQHHELDYFGE